MVERWALVMLVNSINAYTDRLHEIRYSTDSITGMAQKYADFYGAVAADRTYTEDGRYYIFALGTKEYMQARWLFQQAIQLAYPHVNGEKLYTAWLMCDGSAPLAQLAEYMHRAQGQDYAPWGAVTMPSRA